MGNYYYYLTLLPQALAMIHYFRNRPEGYWFWIILFFGPVGAIIYFFAVVITGTPGSVEDKVRLGMKERRRANALQAKMKAGEALPYDYSELGELLFKFKKFDQAAEYLAQAVKKAPANMDARYYLGLSFEKLGRFEDAGRNLEPLVIQDSKFKFGEAMHSLARCYRGAGEKQAAIAAYKKVLSQNNFPEARFSLAELLVELGKKDEAREHLERLVTDAGTSLDMPSYQRRNEKKWARKAQGLLETIGK